MYLQLPFMPECGIGNQCGHSDCLLSVHDSGYGQ